MKKRLSNKKRNFVNKKKITKKNLAHVSGSKLFGSRVLNLDENTDFLNITSNVYQNIELFENIFGKKFNIVYLNIIYPVIIQSKYDHIKKQYVIRYDSEPIDGLYPFKIIFYNSSECDIDNIHKLDNISGKQIMEFVLYLLKFLKIYKVSLSDAATADCFDKIVDLSQLKLLEKNKTYYNNFGFELELDTQLKKFLFENDVNAKNILNNIIQQIKAFKVSNVLNYFKKVEKIFQQILKQGNFEDLEIIKSNGNYQKDEIISNIDDFFSRYKELYKTMQNLNSIPEQYHTYSFIDYLLHLFNNKSQENCNLYDTFDTNMIGIQQTIYKYRKKIVGFDMKILFEQLSFLRHITYVKYFEENQPVLDN